MLVLTLHKVLGWVDIYSKLSTVLFQNNNIF